MYNAYKHAQHNVKLKKKLKHYSDTNKYYFTHATIPF